MTPCILSTLSPRELLHLCLQNGKTALHAAVSSDKIQDNIRVLLCEKLLQGKANLDMRTVAVSWPRWSDGAVYGNRLHCQDDGPGCGCEVE